MDPESKRYSSLEDIGVRRRLPEDKKKNGARVIKWERGRHYVISDWMLMEILREIWDMLNQTIIIIIIKTRLKVTVTHTVVVCSFSDVGLSLRAVLSPFATSLIALSQIIPHSARAVHPALNAEDGS